jgi:hypothetical protein
VLGVIRSKISGIKALLGGGDEISHASPLTNCRELFKRPVETGEQKEKGICLQE